MVKVRYAELPAGLHVATEARDGCTIVYLLPGLTPPQRRAALTFARRSARIGHGPSLPVIDMALALAADRTRTISRAVLAVLRRHPMLLLPMVAVVSGVIVVAMLSLVTVTTTPLWFPTTDPTPHGVGGRPANGADRTGGGPAAPGPKQTSPRQASTPQPSPQRTSTPQTSAPQPSAPQTSAPQTGRPQNSQQDGSQRDFRDSTTPTPLSAAMPVVPSGVRYLSAQASETPSADYAPAANAARSYCIAFGPTTICARL
jgi:hypothetical protein